MPKREAVVTLHPLFFPHDLPFRSLTFVSDSDRVSIGRSSKRESKNLVPAHHNAWFDSRVMSRDHATLRVSLEKESVYIRDGGSMHGTWVNGTRIPVGQDITIHTGDMLTFGTEVTRGAETFPPLKVRCEFNWFYIFDDETQESNVHKTQVKRASNCFTAPEDDDDDDDHDDGNGGDVVEIVYDSVTPLKEETTCSSDIDNSDAGSDVEDRPACEHSTPITSPSVKGTEFQKDSLDTSSLDGSRQSPIVLDAEQPLVTPRMTPPLVNRPDSDATTTDNRPFDFVGHDLEQLSRSGSPVGADPTAEDWDGEEENFDLEEDDSMSQSSYGLGTEESDRDDDSEVAGCTEPLETPFNTGSSFETAATSHCSAPGEEQVREHTPEPTKDDSTAYVGVDRSEACGSDGIATTVQPQNKEQTPNKFGGVSYNTVPFQDDWASMSKPCSISSPHFRPMDRSLDPPLPSLQYSSFPTPMDDWTPPVFPVTGNSSYGPPSLQAPCSPRMAYMDGPFVNSRSRSATRHVCNAPNVTNLANFGNNSLESHYGAHASERNYGLPQPGLSSLCSGRAEEADKLAVESTPMKTRVSIADIVEASSEARPCQRPSMKRKAEDMELDSPDTSLSSGQVLGSQEESFSQEAQRQISLEDLQDSTIDLHPVKVSSCEAERPRKRTKTAQHSRTRNIASHAATALVGAVVGGVGTVALLASLPPDFFH